MSLAHAAPHSCVRAWTALPAAASVPPFSPGEERHGPRSGCRDAGAARRRTDAGPAEERGSAEEAERDARRPRVPRGGRAGARRWASLGVSRNRWGTLNVFDPGSVRERGVHLKSAQTGVAAQTQADVGSDVSVRAHGSLSGQQVFR